MKQNYIAVLVIASLLAGCSTPAIAPFRSAIKQAEDSATSAINNQKDAPARERENLIENVHGVWVPLERVDEANDRAAVLDRPFVVSRSFKSFTAAAEYIGAKIGMPVAIAPDVLGSSKMEKASGEQKGRQNVSAEPKSVPEAGNPITLEIDGTIRSALDELAFRQSISYELVGRGIRFFKLQTKSFEIAALPGDSNGNNVVSSSGSSQGAGSSSGSGTSSSNGSSGGSSGTQTSGVSYKLVIWKSIEQNVKSMLSTEGIIVPSPESGSVLVTDTPKVLADVGKYIENLNAQMSKQVMINVRVLAVQLDGNDQYGINWTAVYSNLGKAGFKLTNSNSIVNASDAINGVISVPQGAPGSLANWVGSSAMVQALATQGDVSQVTSASLITLNNQPAPMLVGNQQSYLASSSATPGSIGVQPTVTLTPGQLNTGFSLTVVPHILENDKIMLQAGAEISSLVSLGSYTSGLSSIQIPNYNTRSFLQRVKVTSGETLVLTGFEQTNLEANAQGIGNADFMGAGGGFSKKKSRTVLVVLLQPVLLK